MIGLQEALLLLPRLHRHRVVRPDREHTLKQFASSQSQDNTVPLSLQNRLTSQVLSWASVDLSTLTLYLDVL